MKVISGWWYDCNIRLWVVSGSLWTWVILWFPSHVATLLCTELLWKTPGNLDTRKLISSWKAPFPKKLRAGHSVCSLYPSTIIMIIIDTCWSSVWQRSLFCCPVGLPLSLNFLVVGGVYRCFIVVYKEPGILSGPVTSQTRPWTPTLWVTNIYQYLVKHLSNATCN